MKIRKHSESHLVELEDGSRWQVFPGDIDYRTDRIRNLPALRHQHIDLLNLRNDRFRCMPLPCH